MKIQMLKGEYWYGGQVYGAHALPVNEQSQWTCDMRLNRTPNQAAPLFLSSHGRYFYREEGFLAQFKNGWILLDCEVELKEGYGDLRGAYLAAMKAHFPFHEIKLSDTFFRAPVYNSWIELTFFQNEKDILKYAQSILENDMPPGVLMIDDGWSDYYGKWSFNREKFPHPEEMLKTLHEMGFAVMLWLCPFITPDTLEYRETKAKDYLIKDARGNVLITEWWNGHSAALDLSNPAAAKWLDDQLCALKEIGVDGFKFDAGDSMYYREDQITCGNVSPNEMCRLWCEYGEKFPFNEYRAAYRAGGMSLMQRLCDKPHNWEDEGVGALIPDTLAQGILGMPFGSPDMIGGGEYVNFWEQCDRLDEELFVRHSEIACLMPVMQFSAAPWRVLSGENFSKIRKSVAVREQNLSYLMKVLEETKTSGEPMVRYMEYEFPHQGMVAVNDQFMLGSELLVAPVYQKGQESRKVFVPAGKWCYGDETVDSNGEEIEFTPEPGSPILLWKNK